MNELCENLYFRKLFEDFTGATDIDEMESIFNEKIEQNVLSNQDTVLDNYLSFVVVEESKVFIELEINGVKFGYSIDYLAAIIFLRNLLHGCNLPIRKGIDPQICEFPEHTDFLRGKILTCGGPVNRVFDTFEHLVLERRLPRCMEIKNRWQNIPENIRFIKTDDAKNISAFNQPSCVLTALQSGIIQPSCVLTALPSGIIQPSCVLTALPSGIIQPSCVLTALPSGIMVFCENADRKEFPYVNFVDSSDPKVLFPTRTKNARNG